MISVRNRQQRLSGSKLVVGIVFLSFLSSCAILQPSVTKVPLPTTEKPEEPTPEEEEEIKVVEERINKVMLLLPFQLNKIRGEEPSLADVKRAEISLDFYQGFKIALDDLKKDGNNFQLNVVDSQDDIAEVNLIGKSADVQSADLIVGPIFPKEISAFASAANLSYSVQVSPLAATAPSVFKINNLVSLTSPLDQHAVALANYLGKKIKKDDRIIIYNTQDVESQNFLRPLIKQLNEIGKTGFIEINNLDELETKMTNSGKNFFITGTINKYTVEQMLVKLTDIKYGLDFQIQLLGHPSWSKLSFLNPSLNELNTLITTSFYIDESESKTRNFQRRYKEENKLEPTEYAYKGYDTGYFFGLMLAKYGPDFSKSLLKETYKGLQTSYTFEYNPTWGYVNTFIQILQFDGYQYRPIN